MPVTDNLRNRIARGELAALTDPMLPLLLMTEPGADWWNRGAYRAARALVFELHNAVGAAAAAPTLVAWGKAHGEHTDARGWSSVEAVTNAIDAAVFRRGGRYPEQTRAFLGGCRRLRALLPGGPLAFDEALEVLDLYVR